MPDTAVSQSARALHGLPEPLPPLALDAVHTRLLSLAPAFCAGIMDWRHIDYFIASWTGRTVQPRGDRRSRDEYEDVESTKLRTSFLARVDEIQTRSGDAVRKCVRPLIAIRAPRSVLLATAHAASRTHNLDGFPFLTDKTVEAIVADEIRAAIPTVANRPRSTSRPAPRDTYSRRAGASGMSHHAG